MFESVKVAAMIQEIDRANLLNAIQNGNEAAFEAIYIQMAGKLLRYVASRVHDKEASEEIVQEVFLSLWARRHELSPDIALEPYLYGMVKHQILTHIRSEKVRHQYAAHFSLFVAQYDKNVVEEVMDLADLQAVVERNICSLPLKCQEAFRLSRYEHKSIADIAEHMGISTRTVENYITTALKHLRQVLSQSQWTVLLVWLYCQ